MCEKQYDSKWEFCSNECVDSGYRRVDKESAILRQERKILEMRQEIAEIKKMVFLSEVELELYSDNFSSRNNSETI